MVILQGDGGGPGASNSCPPSDITGEPLDDQVSVNEAQITSDMFIVQNADPAFYAAKGGFSVTQSSAGVTTIVAPAPGPGFDGTGDGFNLVQIGTTAQVEGVGGMGGLDQTYVFQGGSSNTVILGGANDPSGIDFETEFLDIWTGAGGNGFVMATNTVVDVGSFYGFNWVINGAGGGNLYVDGGNNFVGGVPGSLPIGPGYGE